MTGGCFPCGGRYRHLVAIDESLYLRRLGKQLRRFSGTRLLILDSIAEGLGIFHQLIGISNGGLTCLFLNRRVFLEISVQRFLELIARCGHL